MTNFMRSDEQAAEAEMERAQARNRNIGRGIKTAVGLGTTALGIGLQSKILPFLNEYIPSDLAVKGISKISPKLGEFLRKGMASGLDIKEGLDFIKDKFTPSKESKKSEKNIVEQYSPELHQFIDQEIKAGKSPLDAGARAHMRNEFKGIIKKIESDHKTPWSAILQDIYGSNQNKAGTRQQPMQQGQQQESMGAAQEQQPSQTQGPGPGQQQLMAILQKLQQARGA